MSISKHLLCVHNKIFQQVNILFSVIKQQVIHDVQHFESSFLNLIFTYNRTIEHNIRYQLQLKMSISQYLLCVHNLIFKKLLFHLVRLNNK